MHWFTDYRLENVIATHQLCILLIRRVLFARFMSLLLEVMKSDSVTILINLFTPIHPNFFPFDFHLCYSFERLSRGLQLMLP